MITTMAKRRAEREPVFRETVATNIYRTPPRSDGTTRFFVLVHPWSATFDSLDEARAWRDRVARIGRRLRLVNLIRAGEAPGRL
jgi:hypothetical protein